MKTIIYILLGVFISGIVAAGIPQKNINTHRITIEATNKDLSFAKLAESAKIISARLKKYSTNKFEINLSQAKNQIIVTLKGEWNLADAAYLIQQKGKIELYALLQRKQVAEKIDSKHPLTTLMTEYPKNETSPVLACMNLNDAAKLQQNLANFEHQLDFRFFWGNLERDSSICLYAADPKTSNAPLMTNEDIDTVLVTNKKHAGTIINLRFKDNAKKEWFDITSKYINRPIAIVLDNRVIYAPLVKAPITGGDCEISGNFSKNEADILSALINYGELPADFNFVK